jgi:hypothetical protein
VQRCLGGCGEMGVDGGGGDAGVAHQPHVIVRILLCH